MSNTSKKSSIPSTWKEAILDQWLNSEDGLKLKEFLQEQRKTKTIFPHSSQVFRAFQVTPLTDVKVIIVGQDPYHSPNTADGIAFSSQNVGLVPPSLDVIFKELFREYQVLYPDQIKSIPKDFTTGSLITWAEQGVLLLNMVLTVEQGKAKSHYNKGWESLTSEVIKFLGSKDQQTKVFMFWGSEAQKLMHLVDMTKHKILTAAHPAAELYNRRTRWKYTGCDHFVQANTVLSESGQQQIDWFSCFR